MKWLPLLELLIRIIFHVLILFWLLPIGIIIRTTTIHLFFKIFLILVFFSNKVFKCRVTISFTKTLILLSTSLLFVFNMILIFASCLLKLFVYVVWVNVWIIRILIAFSIFECSLSWETLALLTVLVTLLTLAEGILVRITKRLCMSIHSHLIVLFLLLWVPKHIVSSWNFLKFGFCRATSFVWVIFMRQLIILLLYLFFVCVLGYPQYLIVINFRIEIRHRLTKFPLLNCN